MCIKNMNANSDSRFKQKWVWRERERERVRVCLRERKKENLEKEMGELWNMKTKKNMLYLPLRYKLTQSRSN